MKKLTAILLSVLLLASCSDGSPQSSSETSGNSGHASRISSAPLNEELIGCWFGEATGYRFQEDRKVSLIMDFSSILHFTEDGSLVSDENKIPAEEIEIQDGNITAEYTDETTGESAVIVDMELIRSSENSDRPLDGIYNLSGGSCRSMIAQSLSMEEQYIDIKVEIDGEKFNVTVSDYCDYETNGDLLELFSPHMNYVDPNATSVKYNFKIEDDVLTLTYESGETEVLERLETWGTDE